MKLKNKSLKADLPIHSKDHEYWDMMSEMHTANLRLEFEPCSSNSVFHCEMNVQVI